MRRRQAIAILAGAAAWPIAVRAADKVHRLAILSHFELVDRATGARERYWKVFFDELRRLGYEEDRNLRVVWFSTQSDAGSATETARTAAAQSPDTIFTPDSRMASVLKTAAAAIPVVAIMVDPVGSGVVASIARPGGNITGSSIDPGPEIIRKRIELLRQAVPRASRVAWVSPRRTADMPVGASIRAAFESAGVILVEIVLEAPIDAATYRGGFAAAAGANVDAVWVGASGETLQHRHLIADLAIAARLPLLCGYRENVEAGGLMSHGNNVAETFRECAGYVDRVLRGAKPADLPIQQPTKYEFAINLKTARALGLDSPPALLARADVIIE